MRRRRRREHDAARPFVIGKAEQAFGKDFKVFDSSIGARFPNPKIESQFGADTMPETADNLARDYQLTREECDVFALGSQQKYAAAKADGFFEGEIQPVSRSRSGQGQARSWSCARTSIRGPRRPWRPCRSSRPLFEGGVTTAGNASGINDGAVALIVASREAGDKAGRQADRARDRHGRGRRAAAHHGLRPGAGGARRRWSAPASTSRTWT